MTVSELKYLMAVNQLETKNKGAKMSDISRFLGVSKVSVYHGMERLQEDGFIDRIEKKIFVTKKGRQALEEYAIIISFIGNHLQFHCGTPDAIAREDAIGAACAFSEISRKGIADFVKTGNKDR